MVLPRRNNSSSIRRGFDYQTLWALNVSLRILSHPNQYRWLRLETSPNDIDNEPFYLDDIVVCLASGKYELYQIKSDASWSLSKLLAQPTNAAGSAKQSLIQKWHQSLKRYENETEEAALITCGTADEQLRRLVNDKGHLSLDIFRSFHPLEYDRAIEQLGSIASARDFFSRFKFRFGEPDIDDLEASTASGFFEVLRATESGVTNLLRFLQKESRQQFTSSLPVETLRRHCDFDVPRPLREDFLVPRDFQIFDQGIHESLVRRIKTDPQGIQVIIGGPGTGKSTYLSSLTKQLKSEGVVVLRHHYHLSPNDPNPQERLDSQRVIEALKAQFKEHSNLLGPLAYTNSKGVSLREFIGSLATASAQKGKAFVLILDGLDHVLREGSETELKEALSEITYPQPGLWLIFGLQPAAQHYLPNAALRECPSSKWITIGGLSKPGVISIVKKNTCQLKLPEEAHSRADLNESIYRLCQGNPLHLRYTLNALKEKLEQSIPSHFDCESLQPYGGDIALYYHALWNGLADSAKTAAIAVSVLKIKLRDFHLSELLGTFDDNPTRITEARNSILHLLKKEYSGISFFHNSFEYFLSQTPEYRDQIITIKRRIRDWLITTNDEYLRWAELPRIEFDLGNNEPLMQIDYGWALSALLRRYPPDKIASLLNLASVASLKAGGFGRAFWCLALSVRIENSVSYYSDQYESIWCQSLELTPGNFSIYDLDALLPGQIAQLSTRLYGRGEKQCLEWMLDELNSRHYSVEIRQKTVIKEAVPGLPSALVSVVSNEADLSVKRVTRYIKQYRNSGWSSELFAIYAEALLMRGHRTAVSALLAESALSRAELSAILVKCVEYDFQYGTQFFLTPATSGPSQNAFILLYRSVKGIDQRLPSLPRHSEMPPSVPEFETGKRAEWSAFFLRLFSLGFTYSVQNRLSTLQRWIDAAPDTWQNQVCCIMAQLGADFSRCLDSAEPFPATKIFTSLKNLRPLRWPEHRNRLEYQYALSETITSILRITTSLQKSSNLFKPLDHEQFTRLFDGDLHIAEYYSNDRWLDFLDSQEGDFLENSAIRKVLAAENAKWQITVAQFFERSQQYARLSRVAYKYGEADSSEYFLEMAARNLIGYGHHKDMFISELVDSLTDHGKHFPAKAGDWVRRLAPIIKEITEFTDGDDVGHVPKQFSTTLGEINRNWLLAYYCANADTEDFFIAESAFASLISYLDPREPMERALITTALDERSFNRLADLAKSGGDWEAVLDQTTKATGVPVFDRDERTDSIAPELNSSPGPILSEITVTQLQGHLQSLGTPWLKTDFIAKWAQACIESRTLPPLEVYNAVLPLLSHYREQDVSSALLDTLYPIVAPIDSEKAFSILCQAHRTDNGWSSFYTRGENAYRRMAYVERHYPKRALEFFCRSILSSDDATARVRYFPIDRPIEFLLKTGNHEMAADILDSAILFTQESMANLALPEALFLKVADADTLSVLLRRLLWPSPVIRERAAAAISELIAKEENSRLRARFFGWLRKLRLESEVMIGVIVLVRAMELGAKFGTAELVDVIPIWSPPIVELLGPKLQIDQTELSKLVSFCRVSEVPSGTYRQSEFFSTYIRSFLPPIYKIDADEIEGISGREFVRMWAYNSDLLRFEVGVEEHVADAQHFMGGPYRPPIYGFSSKLSEIYRSAFLRTLTFFYREGWIPEWKFRHLTWKSVPIDISLWRTSVARIPGWWPANTIRTPNSKVSEKIQQLNLSVSLEELIHVENETVVALSGAIKPSEGWPAGQSLASVQMVAFLYDVTGSNIPDATAVADRVFRHPIHALAPSPQSWGAYFNDNIKTRLEIENDPIEIGDLTIFPIVAFNRMAVNNVWQWWRQLHQSFAPAFCLGRIVAISPQPGGWRYVSDSGTTVASLTDWCEGIAERTPKNQEVPHGCYLTVPDVKLEQLQVKTGLRKAHVMQISHLVKNRRDEELTEVKETYLFGVSRIIL